MGPTYAKLAELASISAVNKTYIGFCTFFGGIGASARLRLEFWREPTDFMRLRSARRVQRLPDGQAAGPMVLAAVLRRRRLSGDRAHLDRPHIDARSLAAGQAGGVHADRCGPDYFFRLCFGLSSQEVLAASE